MKKIILSAAIAMCFQSVQTSYAQDNGKLYGKTFNTDKEVMDVPTFLNAIKDKNGMTDISVSGTITQVCQVAGCWVKLKNNEGEDIFVKFKDSEITVPKDYAGKPVIVHGNATRKTVSVKERQHLAEDAGATKEEIAKITTPKDEIRINANGILIR